ncbi:MAG: hypothetical protein GF411_18635, partial [Candidatus Lokiarchaeota archaeon]|nr:hypothetical protein [Candidatus Lokiarchaeota archaeon]
DISGGWTDTPLTERGQRQAQAVANRLFDMFDSRDFTLFSSDLMRASETAEKISKRFNRELIILRNLRELNNGVAVGLPISEARKIMNPTSNPLVDWIPFEGAESWRMLYERAERVLQEIEREESKCAVIVSHGNMIRCIISVWLGLPPDSGINFDQHTCNITWLRVNNLGERTIKKLNDCGHLAVLELENNITHH